jgi:hypothetical protein
MFQDDATKRVEESLRSNGRNFLPNLGEYIYTLGQIINIVLGTTTVKPKI